MTHPLKQLRSESLSLFGCLFEMKVSLNGKGGVGESSFIEIIHKYEEIE